MTPATYDLIGLPAGPTRGPAPYRGDPFAVPMTLAIRLEANAEPVAVNLTGSTILAQIRARAVDTAAAGTFTATVTNATAGKFTLALSPAQTSTIPNGVYDVQITDNQGVPRTYVAGKISFTQDVSRAA